MRHKKGLYTNMCRFPLFVSLRDHNPLTLQTDRPIDGPTSKDKRDMLGSSMSLSHKNE